MALCNNSNVRTLVITVFALASLVAALPLRDKSVGL